MFVFCIYTIWLSCVLIVQLCIIELIVDCFMHFNHFELKCQDDLYDVN